MFQRLLFSVLIVGVVAGCAAPSPQPRVIFESIPSNAAFGALPVDYQKIAEASFELLLKDFPSARFKHEGHMKAYANAPLSSGGRVEFVGYAVKVLVNAKNSYGGYNGFKPYHVLMWGDARGVYRVIDDENDPTVVLLRN